MKRRNIIILIIVAVVIITAIILFHSCSPQTPESASPSEITEDTIPPTGNTDVVKEEESVANGTTDKPDIVIDVPKTNPDILQNKPADKTDVDESKDDDNDIDDSKQDTKPSGPNSSTATGSGTNKPSAGGNSSGSTGGSSTSGGSNSSEPKTEQVWVVDVPAQTIEEPIYEEKYVSICNRCGAVLITQDELDSHMKDHMLKGEYENCSWHNDYRTIQVGTKTVEVPEQGHWETRAVE